ncbi:uncharacterized protein LOC128234311 [Mya arenaria]|uniref:uncharacterized protein LOC128234311 n=1 Tax=Mya arenaria TaxID=6604 RepID=UPI0022E17EA3|nr:uncharacterized protein LOC128234311 [Mya arenaria]
MLVSVIFTLLCILSLAMSQDKPRIKCYECINLKDNSCGRTFTGNDNYLIECSENATACQKLEYEDSFQGRHTGGLVVSRSCWESSSAEQYVPDTEKCEDMFSSKACYCTGDGCNGGQLLHASWGVLLFALLPLVYSNMKCS